MGAGALATVSWDDPSINPSSGGGEKRKLERFKGETGKQYRMLIIDQPVQVWQHYKKEFGYVRCLKSVGQRCAFCDSGDKPSHKLGVNALLYPANATSPQDVDATNTRVIAWLFGPKVFAELRNIKAEWGDLTSYDIKVECTNAQFQHLTITPARGALWQSSPHAQAIADMIKANIYDLADRLGRTFTEAEVAGIANGVLTADDIFKKKDGSAPQAVPQTTSQAAPQPVAAPAPATPTAAPAAAPAPAAPPPKLDLNALLGRT